MIVGYIDDSGYFRCTRCAPVLDLPLSWHRVHHDSPPHNDAQCDVCRRVAVTGSGQRVRVTFEGGVVEEATVNYLRVRGDEVEAVSVFRDSQIHRPGYEGSIVPYTNVERIVAGNDNTTTAAHRRCH
jgi:hypothetical protein